MILRKSKVLFHASKFLAARGAHKFLPYKDSGNFTPKTAFHDFWAFFSQHGYFMMCMTLSQSRF